MDKIVLSDPSHLLKDRYPFLTNLLILFVLSYTRSIKSWGRQAQTHSKISIRSF